MTAFCSIGMSFDAAAMSSDVAVQPNGQLAIDLTPATPLLISVGSDRRALPDDVLPYNAGPGSPLPFNPRRGWVGDALDTQGQLIGSRLWLLHREKQTDETRRRAIAYATEATDWITAEYGNAVELDAEWIARGVLGLVVQVDGAATTIPVPVA